MCPSQHLLTGPFSCLETIIYTQRKVKPEDFCPCKYYPANYISHNVISCIALVDDLYNQKYVLLYQICR